MHTRIQDATILPIDQAINRLAHLLYEARSDAETEAYVPQIMAAATELGVSMLVTLRYAAMCLRADANEPLYM